jgi:nicotinamidase-related amidase
MAVDIQKADTAVVFIDPQNDVLSEKGANWGAVGASVTENRTVDLTTLFLPDRQCGAADKRFGPAAAQAGDQ